MINNKRQKLRAGIVVIAILVLVVVMAVMFLIVRYTPTKEKMDGYQYFEIEKQSQKVLVIVDGERYPDTGEYIEGRLYIPISFVEDNINTRFYYDKESDGVMYSDQSDVYLFSPSENKYTDDAGKSYDMDYPVVEKSGNECYVEWEYIADHTECIYEYGSEPSRVNITLAGDTEQCVTAAKKLAVRYKGGIKSPVLETVPKGTRLVWEDDLDDWVKVTTPSGMTGYVKKADVSEQFEYIPEGNYTEESRNVDNNGKITLGWFQVASAAGNAYVDDYTGSASGLNVISPTWYSISNASGEVTSYASAAMVSKMHAQGIKVWPLVNDFDKNIDYEALFSSRTARKKLTDTLISDAVKNGYDGINLDFENVKSSYAKDFLQFVRELSVQCAKAGLVLSTDNYKPEAYNRCYNLAEQSAFVDYIIIMAYDEHYAGSDAGSVASLQFVKEAVEDTLKDVPSGQLIVGIPFYTRIWTTSGGQTTSKAVSMQAALDQLNSDGQTALWNDDCGQYVASYAVGNSTRQIWFEEEKSIEAKMQLIQENNTAGVACWKLGLEKTTVWPVINKYNK